MALFDSENNVGQFGADNSNIIRYKQAAEYAEDARLYALAAAEAVVDADNLMNRAEELLQEARDLADQVESIQAEVDQLEEDVAAAQATVNDAIARAQQTIDAANAALAQAQASQAAAAASATAAAGSASTATTQATNAANSASAANTSAGNASTSATNAANSASAASADADRAEAAADSIDTDAIDAKIATKANKGANSDITSITGLTTALAVNQGGTGAISPIIGAYNIGALPLRGNIGSNRDLNSMGPTSDFIGVWGISTTADLNGLLNAPEAGVGAILEVFAYGSFGCTQRFSSRYGPVYVRMLAATWNASSPSWGEWFHAGLGSNFGAQTIDVNTLMNAGRYAVNGASANLPVTQAGNLEVTRYNSSATNIQQIFRTQVSNASYTNRMFIRIYAGTAWSQWSEVVQSPLISNPASGNNTSGPVFINALDTDTQSTTHQPVSGELFGGVHALRGLRPAQFGVSGRGTAASFWFRGYNAATSDLTEWKKVVITTDVIPVAQGGTGTSLTDGTGAINIGALPLRGTPASTITDVNTMGASSSVTSFIGVWDFSGNAQYTMANLPEAIAGMLEVFNGGSFRASQRYTTRYGAIYTRNATATWTAASPNNWGPWLCAANAIAGTFFTGDLNTLITPGEYAVTAAATNIPPTSGSAGRVIVETRTPTPTTSFGDVTQTFSAFSVTASMTNRVWKRTYQSSASSWGAWYEVTTMDLNGITRALRGVDSTLTLGADGANPLDAVSLRQMQTAIANVSSAGGITGVMSTFIGDVSWWQGSAANIPTGYVNPTGQLSLRTDYPEIWSLINAGVLSSTTDALWNSSAGNRGKFSTGTVTTGTSANFRWPDLNGAVSGTPTGVFLRGAYTGPDNVGSAGEMRGPGAPNITGNFNVTPDGANVALMNNQTGAFAASGNLTAVAQISNGSGAANRTPTTSFDASRSSIVYGSGYTEIRPSSVVGLWIMRAKGTFSAQTSFNVMTSVASAPANNSTTEGGLVRSALMQGTTELGGVNFKYRHLVDASGVVSKRAVINVTGGTGEVRVAEDGSVGIDGGLGVGSGASITGDTVINGNLTFTTQAQRRALLTHLGVAGTNSRLVIPISATQAVQILCVAAAPTTNSSGDATINFPFAFANVGNLVVSNGNGAVAMATVAVINAIRTTSFDVRAYNNGSPQVGQFQFNYVVMGLINI